MPALPSLIRQAERIVLISHIRPDGDAMGSLVGLGLGLEQMGKEVTLVLTDGVPPTFRFLKGASTVQSNFPDPTQVDLVIFLDANEVSRSGAEKELKLLAAQKKMACIDHHPKGDADRLSQSILHDETVSSTSELLYSLMIELGIRITPEIATALLTGIFTDTGGFQHPNSSSQTLDLAADLMRRGGRLHRIAQHISQSKSLANLRLLGIALKRLRLTHNNQVAYSVITHQDLKMVGASPEDLNGFISRLNVLPEIRICLLLLEIQPGIITGELRTGNSFSTNVRSLARILGGGGHPRAAGFSIPGKPRVDQAGNWQILDQSKEKS